MPIGKDVSRGLLDLALELSYYDTHNRKDCAMLGGSNLFIETYTKSGHSLADSRYRSFHLLLGFIFLALGWASRKVKS